MCCSKTKSGCTCHWAAELGPNRSRRIPGPSLTAPPDSSRNAQNTTIQGISLRFQPVPLAPPTTPIHPLRLSDSFDSPFQTPPSTRKQKSPLNGIEKPPAKRRNTGCANGIVFGVGPSDTPRCTEPSRLVETDRTPPRKPHPALSRPAHGPPITARRDVWAFMRAVNSIDLKKYKDLNMPLETVTALMVRPKSDYVGCMLCENDGKRRAWSNDKNPQTTTLDKHLRQHPKWIQQCADLGITQKQKTILAKLDLKSVQLEPYTPEGLVDHLIRWIAVDDQSINVVESPEFRRVLLYCGRQVKNSHIPRRTKTTDALKDMFTEMWTGWLNEVQCCPGRVSFTTDLWTDPNLHPFMAVTAHFIQEKESGWTLEARLVAFHSMPGSHDGESLGNTFVNILEKLGLAHKVGQITADNASNNGTMTEAMETALTARGIPFSRSDNRVRCFPHIINLAVQDFLTSLKLLEDDTGISEETADALRADPVERCRKLVGSIRLTSQRRDEFRKTVADGQKSGSFDGDQLELLRDMPVRWSSTYHMISRFLAMSKAVDLYLARPGNRELLIRHGLDETTLNLLGDVDTMLLLFNSVQALVSSERTPTLAVSLPAYEYCLQSLNDVIQSNVFPHLDHAIRRSVDKIAKYVKIARKNRVYGIAMFINPSCKKSWMQKHWPEEEVEGCMDAIRDSMMAYCKKELRKQPDTSSSTPTSAAASFAGSTLPSSVSSPNVGPSNLAQQKLHSGFQNLRAWSTKVSGSSSGRQTMPSSNTGPSTSSTEDIEARARDDVEAELLLYLSHPRVTDDISACDILRFWQTFHRTYPILWKVARDVLPVQASSVACERIFSSAKLTTTVQRNKLSPEMIEILQILKFGLKQDQLSFTTDWVMAPDEIYALEHEEDWDSQAGSE